MVQRSGLRAPIGDLMDGLAGAGLETRCDVQPDLRLSQETEALLFRVVRESLHNVRKHAQATRVDVSIRARDGVIALTIADDGSGFDTGGAHSDSGLGLQLLTDLVGEAGGHMRVDSAPGSGTVVRVEVPS